ncbi:ATP-binding cassette domain-containing protein [uncultured Amaricoccus sp.]|uniref:ABC transporter ATP-binding protein n=1 Tax=uncultured Amaricoccus sp. TaxID=339341 RepID=UPI00262DFAA2|nr:ATP-binding cassette domain-containing protein [uncultured Amaricoccus sp.]
MAEPLVKAAALARVYQRGAVSVTALAPVSFRIERGDRVGLIGPSGSGKTTLLNLVAGLDQPSSGWIAWPALGESAVPRPRSIGAAFQSRSLIPTLSCGENVELPLALLDEAADAPRRALEALEAFGVADLADKLPGEVSGGQAQRVALARAIITGPSLLLADEPTGQLDSLSGASTLDSLGDWLDRTGAALLLATHDPTASGRMKAIWRLDHGVVQIAKRKTS